MKKLFTCTAIVFLTLFTAALISTPPATAVSIPTITTGGTGTLWFVNSDTGEVTPVAGTVTNPLTITLTNAIPSQTGEPADIWTGTLTFPPCVIFGNTVPLAVEIAAFRGPDNVHFFHDMHGTIGTGAMTAEGNDYVYAWDSASTPTKTKLGFYIRGTVNDPGTFVGIFEGVLFYISP